ncbi:MAG: DinB family protein [Acidimicrobiia bacterium]|nr:DinB family protein [Acidimicrobiia bacterium]
MSAHEDRINGIRTAFEQATAQLVASLEALDDTRATTPPASGWNAAQIGWHVALSTEFLSGVMAGRVAEMNVPRPPDFRETLATMQFPDKVQTFPMLEPPATVTRADTVAKLQASRQLVRDALSAATPDRCASTCIEMPFGTMFSVYEVGEFMAAHVTRHIGQLKRTVGS